MRIANWNVRGLGDSDKCSLVNDALMYSRSNAVCLQETKLRVVDVMKAASFLPSNLRSFIFMPASGSSGELLVAWYMSVLAMEKKFSWQKISAGAEITEFQLAMRKSLNFSTLVC